MSDLDLGRRVLVIGSPGTGKSTIARLIADRTGLPAVHLDRLYHDPDEDFVHDRARWRAHLVGDLLGEESWVMDGHYAATLAQRIAVADSVVYLDLPTRVAVSGVFGRRLRPQTGRDDMPDDWHERVSMSLLWSVLTFRRVEAPRVRRLLSARAVSAKVVRLRSRDEADRFVQSLAAGP